MSEYVLSNELVSRALAMASESPMVKDILAELFVAEGNELYIEPANQYIRYQILPGPWILSLGTRAWGYGPQALPSSEAS